MFGRRVSLCPHSQLWPLHQTSAVRFAPQNSFGMPVAFRGPGGVPGRTGPGPGPLQILTKGSEGPRPACFSTLGSPTPRPRPLPVALSALWALAWPACGRSRVRAYENTPYPLHTKKKRFLDSRKEALSFGIQFALSSQTRRTF